MVNKPPTSSALSSVIPATLTSTTPPESSEALTISLKLPLTPIEAGTEFQAQPLLPSPSDRSTSIPVSERANIQVVIPQLDNDEDDAIENMQLPPAVQPEIDDVYERLQLPPAPQPDIDDTIENMQLPPAVQPEIDDVYERLQLPPAPQPDIDDAIEHMQLPPAVQPEVDDIDEQPARDPQPEINDEDEQLELPPAPQPEIDDIDEQPARDPQPEIDDEDEQLELPPAPQPEIDDRIDLPAAPPAAQPEIIPAAEDLLPESPEELPPEPPELLVDESEEQPLATPKAPMTEAEAARIFKRGFRNSQSPVDMIKHGTAALADLPHDKFQGALKRAADKLDQRNDRLQTYATPRQAEVREGVAKLTEERIKHQKTNIIPVFTPKGHGQLPDFQMKPASALPDDPSAFTVAVASPEDAAKITKFEPTKDNVEEAMAEFLNRKDLISWDYKANGCYVRSQAMIHHFIAWGVPTENLDQTVVLFPKGSNWGYHIAPAIKLDTGEWVAVDPYSKNTKTMSKMEWAQRFSGDHDVNDLGRQTGPQIHFEADGQYNLVTIGSNMIPSAESDFNNGVFAVMPVTNPVTTAIMGHMGEFRGEHVDAPFIRKTFKDALS